MSSSSERSHIRTGDVTTLPAMFIPARVPYLSRAQSPGFRV